MKGFVAIFIGTLLLIGCQIARPSSPEEFIDKIYQDMRTIQEAANGYMNDHGELPRSPWEAREILLETGYLSSFPSPPPEIFTAEPMEYRLEPYYDRIDANDAPDAVIAVWGIKDDVCRAFNNRYSSNHSGPTIYDWKAAGKEYPAATIGREMKVYAIKWESDAVDDCEIERVIKYR